MDLWIIFLTGLTVGGLTCLAVQGGLLASTIAAREERKHTIFATSAFLVSKLAVYTILGFILGSFGGAINITPNVQIAMQLLAGLYMVAISSANAYTGALIMFFFVLGTTPLFFGVGVLTTFLGDNFQGKFLKFAAI